MKTRAFVTLMLTAILVGCGSGNGETTPDITGPVTPPKPSVKSTKIVTQGFEVSIYNRLAEQDADAPEYNLDTPYQMNEPVTYRDVVFHLNTQTESVKLTSLDRFKPFQLISKAYALSLMPPQTEENIVSIDITSAMDFSQEHPSGSKLNALFSVTYDDALNKYYSYKNDTKTFFTVDEFLQYGRDGEPLNAGFNRNLVLNTGPEYPGNMSFYISIELDNGKVFSLETEEIAFKVPDE
ncbi:DUF5034 domain-containing protein [Pseudoalteromonas sp. McH1-42]|uniref:DUF5034 domain-containing protein n=1 Tax=Pseudoalteromonas sp. McH1-42 TaxID=2917752 RepID=UPI001EF67F58|nr:DUF5034 domain-containing protein [Pseudoalteromonas sp. McH1-42]MCG7561550.1 DUF5034 domain-containing protein [Pseudoalteromonas sp. McH1-42]